MQREFIHPDPIRLASLREDLSRHGYYLFSGLCLRELFRVGKLGHVITPRMVRELRRRGIGLACSEELRSQDHWAVAYALGGPSLPEGLVEHVRAVNRVPMPRRLGHVLRFMARTDPSPLMS
jgi:hypothetical protein